TSATVYSGRKQTLQATTSNCGAAGVTWSVDPTNLGVLSPDGMSASYTAPQGVVSTQTATVKATVTGGTATATALITIQPSQPPALSTMSPNNSSGTRQQFAFTVSDAQGQADIAGLQVVFLSDWAYTCQISFNAEFNLLGFRLDNGTWTDVPLGGAQAPTNSYCTLYAATSSVTRSGNQLTLTLDLQFKPIFSGQKSVLAAASDYAGNVVGYQEVGKWLVPGVTGTSQSSIIQFWTPSQVYPGQPFQVALTVRNTGQNIWQSSGLNSSQPHRLVSWNPQGNSTWGVSSIELPVQQVLPGQDVTILINATAPYTLGAQSFDWRMLYQGVEAFGQTASASITVTSTPYPESPHPYPNSTNQTWSYYYNGSCGSLSVTFDSQTFLQSGDWLYVTDFNGYAISGSPFSGSTLAGQTISVPGSSVFLQLVSNASGNGWGFRVTNVTCVPPPPPPGFYDDFHPEVLYASNWYHDTQFSQPKNGTISYSDTAWASVEFSFYGTGIQYYYTKAFNRGIAYVYIDGQYVGSVDQYSPTIEWQSSRMFGGLARGLHTIRIYVSGTKQSASQWHWVDVDGFQTYQ
ncbi:MAG: NBR1-Ig-like domain-containing protein, partial [Bryobacteraceae bacterium]